MKHNIIIAILLLLSSCCTTKMAQSHHEATATTTRHEHKVDSMARKSVASEHIEDIAEVVIVVEHTIYDTGKPDTLGKATIKEVRRTTISKTSKTTTDKEVAETIDSTSNHADTTYIRRTIEAHEDTTEGTGDKPPWWALLTILGLLISIIGLVYQRSSPK
jgi:hypothetical protein